MGNEASCLFGNENGQILDALAVGLNSWNALNQNNMNDEEKQLSNEMASFFLNSPLNNFQAAPQKPGMDKYHQPDIYNFNMDEIDKYFVESASKKKLLISGYFRETFVKFDSGLFHSFYGTLTKYILFAKDGKLIIKENEKYELISNDIDHPYEFEEILIKKNGTLTTNHTDYQKSNNPKGGMLFIKCMGHIILCKNSKINLDGKGWRGGYGNTSGGGWYKEKGGGNENGLGPGGGTYSSSSNNHAATAGNGSYGTSNYSASTTKVTYAKDLSGKTYGDKLLTKMYRGSGGATPNKWSGRGGNGGGSLWVHTYGDIIMYQNASICCNGEVRDKRAGGGSGGSIYLECNELIWKEKWLTMLSAKEMIIGALGGQSTYKYRGEEYVTISKCGGAGRIRIKQNKYKQDEFIEVDDLFQQFIYPQPFWGPNATEYVLKLYEETTINPEIEDILDRYRGSKCDDIQHHDEYDKDIVDQCLLFGLGTKSQIIDAMDNVVDKNNINDICDYLERKKSKVNDKAINNITKPKTFQIFAKIYNRKTITLDVESNDSIKNIKQKIMDKEGIPVGVQTLAFSGYRKKMEDNTILSDYAISHCSTIHLIKMRPYTAYDNEQIENGKNKVRDIKIDCDEFTKLILKCLNKDDFDFPESLCKILYEYSQFIGGDKNYEGQYNELHKVSGIEEAEKLLKSGYYVDQWTVTGFENPLWIAVHRGDVELVELYILNGARRRIRFLVNELNKCQGSTYYALSSLNYKTRTELLAIMSPLVDEDPVFRDDSCC